MKKFSSYSKKQKTWITVGIIAAVLAVVGIVFAVFRPDPAVDVLLAKVEKDKITQEIASSASVESGSRTTFHIPNGTMVKNVNVKPGDKVKKGDVLATFDVSSLNAELASRQKAYNDAVATKNNASASAAEAKAKLPSINKQIAELEKKVAALEKEKNAAAATEPAKPAEETTTAPSQSELQKQIQAIIKKLLGTNGTASQIKDLMDKLNQMASNGVDISQMAGGSAELIQAQMDLAQLKMQKSILEAQSGNAMNTVYDTAVKITKSSLDELKNNIEALKNGWTAANDGIVTAVNIQAETAYQSGAQSGAVDFNSILSALMSSGADAAGISNIVSSLTSGGNVGMTVDSYDDFFVTIPIGKYDLSRVKVGQKASIETADNIYEGEVVYISPVAEQDAGFNINSITSSLTGGSTSSSVNVKIKINNPGEDVIIGMDVDVTIVTEEKDGALLVPVEAVQTVEDKKFVYVYKPEDKIVRKTEVRIGLANDTVYEIAEGLNAGEQIVKNPKSELVDKSRVKVQKEEVSTDSAIYLSDK